MIGYIKGTVEEIFEDHMILEKNGIGYRIFISSLFRNSLEYGDEIKVYTYMSVKEDGITLFGFSNRDEMDLYKMLLSVNGVGPKAAMSILSCMSCDEFKMAILASDYGKISKAQGIGKKTAQKILLELKDKFDFEETVENTLSQGITEGESNAVADTAQALAALGYSHSEAIRAARKAAGELKDADSSVLLKKALKYL